MPRQLSFEWMHVRKAPTGGEHAQECIYCKATFTANSATRVRAHFIDIDGDGDIKCEKLPLEFHASFKTARQKVARKAAAKAADKAGDAAEPQTKMRQLTMPDSSSLCHRTEVRNAIARFFYAEGIPLQKVGSAHLDAVCKALLAAGANAGARSLKLQPSYYELRGKLLDNAEREVDEVVRTRHEAVVGVHGYSATADGYTNQLKQKLINIVITTLSGSSFVRVVEVSDDHATGDFLADTLEAEMAKLPGGVAGCVVLCTDSAPNYACAGRILEQRHPHLSWIPCTAHSCDLFLKAVGKTAWAKPLIKANTAIIKAINNRSRPLSIFHQYSKLAFVQHGETRFATNVLSIKRTLLLRPALRQTVADPKWFAWLATCSAAHRASATAVVADINNDAVWDEMALFCKVAEPVVQFMRVADGAAPGSICQVYKLAHGVTAQLAAIPDLPGGVLALWEKRRTKLLVPAHTVAHLLHPATFSAPPAVHQDPARALTERTDFKKYIERHTGNDVAQTAEILKQYRKLTSLVTPCHMRDPSIVASLGDGSVAEFWHNEGFEFPLLQRIGRRLCAQLTSSSVTERVWSHYDYIHNKRRNRLGVARARKLVKIYGHFATERAMKRAAASADEVPPQWLDAVQAEIATQAALPAAEADASDASSDTDGGSSDGDSSAEESSAEDSTADETGGESE